MTSQKNKINLGIVGMGAMGKVHARRLFGGEAPSINLVALCDHNPEAATHFPSLAFYADFRDLLGHEGLDAVFIATPHFQHAEIGVAALEQGLHTMVEKPMAADKDGCEQLIAARERSGKVLSVMLSMRTKPVYSKIKELLQENELGAIRRVHWTATNWFRTEAYYASSDWRGTWDGEGGGFC